MNTNCKNYPQLLFYILLVLIPVIVSFLPFASQLGFYNDDWYLIYTAHTQGSQSFFTIFASDRPGRAFFMAPLYDLLGDYAPYYSYSAFLLRLIGAFGILWIFKTVWSKKRYVGWYMAALIAIYPGFLDQPNAFDFQSHIFSFTLAIYSIAFTVNAVKARRLLLKIILHLLATIFGAAYLFLMEYYIGLEGLRFLILYYICFERNISMLSLGRFKKALAYMIPSLLVIIGFVFWRIAIFDNQRSATDIGGMIANISNSPILTISWIFGYLVQDLFNSILFAWFIPFYQIALNLRLRDFFIGIGLSAITSLVFIWLLIRINGWKPLQTPCEESNRNWKLDIIVMGCLGVIFCLLPVLFGNRHIAYPDLSRFALPASIGAIMVVVGFLEFLPLKVKYCFLFLLVFLATMTNYSNSIRFVNTWQTVRNFWWQVSWRAPQLAEGTTISVDYANVAVGEDYFVWGPANLVYDPNRKASMQTPLKYSGLVLNQDTINNVILGKSSERIRREIHTIIDTNKLLILSMPTSQSCMHAIDGQFNEFSLDENDRIIRTAPYSHIERIIPEGDSAKPLPDIFGNEPEQSWCYYYEKADLARQKGNWQNVAELGDKARTMKLHPSDLIEWMPFVQAYAYLGRYEDAKGIAAIIKDMPFLKNQTCLRFSQLADCRRGMTKTGKLEL